MAVLKQKSTERIFKYESCTVRSSLLVQGINETVAIKKRDNEVVAPRNTDIEPSKIKKLELVEGSSKNVFSISKRRKM